MRIVVAPELGKTRVLNEPVPAVETVILAVAPAAVFAPDRLYVTVYVPTGNPTAVEVNETLDELFIQTEVADVEVRL